MSTQTIVAQRPAIADPALAHPSAGYAVGAPRMILRLEGGIALAVAAALYAKAGGGWPLFALLFLAPDLSMLGYLRGRRAGAVRYNLGHSYLLPAVLGAAGLALGHLLLVSLALIWVAHIGFDRLLGYGLKYEAAFGLTHLGRVGKDAPGA